MRWRSSARHATASLMAVAMALLCACAAIPSPNARLAHAEQLAEARGWQRLVLPAQPFELLAFAPPAPSAKVDLLTVYVEGDGLAWVTGARPSDDPTPRDPVALRLALAQPEGTAAYLARPCQFVLPLGQGQGCDARYWADERFSPEVIDATSRALDQLLRRFSPRRLMLVGYSGGGAVAALLAAHRRDVDGLVTVAGNLDHAAWTSLHGAAPLRGSLNPANERRALEGLPQWHLAGAQDRVMPPAITQGFAAGFSVGPPPRVLIVAGADHGCCWPALWPGLWRDVLTELDHWPARAPKRAFDGP